MIREIGEYTRVANEDYNNWLQSNYELIKNDFGKKVVYKGNDWIIIGVEIKEKEKNPEYDNGTWRWKLESEFYLKIKKSFEEETIIKLSDYLLYKKGAILNEII